MLNLALLVMTLLLPNLAAPEYRCTEGGLKIVLSKDECG